MQSGSREYNGRNQYWTPSTIGLTQSLIDTSINKIELKDSSSELFTIENNKVKPTIPMVCDEPTADEEVTNKEYVDLQYRVMDTTLKSKYLTSSDASSIYLTISSAKSTYATKPTYSHYYLYTSPSGSADVTISNVLSYKAMVQIALPTTITGNAIFVSVNFRVQPSSAGTSYLNKLACVLNSDSTIGDLAKMLSSGCAAMAIPYPTGGYIFSLSQIFTNLTTKKVYLHFFYTEAPTGSIAAVVIPVSSTSPNVEVTVVGI